MSTVDARLNKLMPALSAKERFLLELQSYKLSEKPDPVVRKTAPDDQRSEFNSYVRRFNAVNRKLGAYTIIVRLLVDKLLATASLLLVTCDLGSQVWDLAKLIPAGKRTTAEAIVSDSIYPVDLPWDAEDRPGSWLEQAEDLLAGVRAALCSRWQEVLAAETVLDEIAEDFDGKDVALPEMREWLAESKQELELIGRLVDEERPTLTTDGPPLTDLREMLSSD